MQLARVVGTVYGTRKDASLETAKLLMLQPIDAAKSAVGAPLVAVDSVGAGVGEIVLYVTAYEAAIPWKRRRGLDLAATDATIVGIVDPSGLKVGVASEGAR
jgi:ethanolamine utilization protein EutN